MSEVRREVHRFLLKNVTRASGHSLDAQQWLCEDTCELRKARGKTNG